MSDSRQIVALNIGSSRVTMGVFAKSGKKLTLSRYASRHLIVDPSAGSIRPSQVGTLVGELIAELNIKRGELNYAVAGQDVFIRFIKLPPITNADVNQLVKFEAQQQIPFPLDEIIWDYHLLPPSGGEQEVVLVAIKSDALNTLNDEFIGLGMTTGHVDSSAIALYNAYRDSYPAETDPVMIIDIGAKTTDLIYTEHGKFFTRSASAAGVFITSAISRDLGVSFADAEQLKLTQGMVSMSNGQMEGMAPERAALATSIRNAMTRVVSEVQRTTNHYRAQINGTQPVKAYLAGGGALLPYTKEFIEEKLGIPVSFFNPIYNVEIGNQVSPDAISGEAILLGNLIGTALHAMERTSLNIDLEPTVTGVMREAKRKFPRVLIGSIVAVLGASFFAWAACQSVQKSEEEYANINKIASQAKGLTNPVNTEEKKIKSLDDQLERYSWLTLQRYGYIDIIRKFIDHAHSDAFWVVDFDPVIGYDTTHLSGISGVSVIKDSYAVDKASSLMTSLPQTGEETSAPARPSRRGTKADEAELKGVYVNAVRLKIFARLAKGGDKIVQDIKNKIEKDENSLFTFKDAQGKTLETKQVIAQNEAKPGAASDGTPFVSSITLVLPLKTPLPIVEKTTLENK